jgi:hypothetical protein
MSRLAQATLAFALAVPSLARAEPPSTQAPSPPSASHNDSGSFEPSAASLGCAPAAKRLVFGADFAPFVGTSSTETGRVAVRRLSLNVVGGYAGGLRGFEVGSVVNLEHGCVEGVQVAGVLNATEGLVRGLQVSGVANVVRGSLRGVQVAGALNLTGGVDAGVELAGAANVVVGEVKGAQISGGANVTSRFVRGLQLTGGANVSGSWVNGAQIAGGMNYASEVAGLQLAPLNLSSGRVRGAQIGVVNIAEQSDFSLGVVSINTRGRTQVEGWSAVETGLFAAALKHGGSHWHGLYGLGTRATDPKLGLVLGFGGDMPLGEHFYWGADVVGYWEPHFKRNSELATLIQPRAFVGLRILKPLSVFAGASYNVLIANRRAANWAPDYAERAENVRDPLVRLWPGAIVGVRLLAE